MKKMRIDFSSVLGVPIGIALVLIGQALEGGTVRSLVQPTAALIVFGGTLGAVLLSFSRNDVLRAIGALKMIFLWEGEPPSKTITMVMEYAKTVRKNGILSLENELGKVPDPFLCKALTLAVDGTNPQQMREMLETENESREEYDEIPAKVYEAAGGYAPTLGILGAILGLIEIMRHLSDPSKLGAGIAVAFVATIYGVGSANLFFLPMATKLKMKARHAARQRELLLEGVLAIQEGLSMAIVEEKLRGFAAQSGPAQESRSRAA